MSKKTEVRSKKKIGPAAGPKNSLLKATVISERGEQSFDAIASAIESARRTFSLPRTLLSKGRNKHQTQHQTQQQTAATRYGSLSLADAVSRSTGEYSAGSTWLPRPLGRLKFGILSILVILGLAIGILSATHFFGPYQNSVTGIQHWFTSSAVGQKVGLNQKAGEQVLEISEVKRDETVLPVKSFQKENGPTKLKPSELKSSKQVKAKKGKSKVKAVKKAKSKKATRGKKP